MTIAVPIALLIGMWLLGAVPAGAHALVVGSNPQAATRIARAPAELRVSFSEAVRPLGQALTMQGPDGQVRLGQVGHPDGRADVLAATLPKLADGSYVVSWRIVSADDGHLQAGSFAFAVGAGSGTVVSPAPPQLPTAWQVTGRWLETAGVLLLVGVVATALTVWRRPGPIGADEPRYQRLGVVAAVVAVAGLVWQVAAGAATSGAFGPGSVTAFLAASPTTARRMVAEVVLLAGATVLIWWGAKRGRRPGLVALVPSGGAVAAVVWGAHVAGQATRWLFVPLEVVHLLAVGTWIGGLAVLALTARRAGIAAVRRFSVLALRVVLVVAVTGIWQGLAQVSSRAALADTDYGRILAAKVAAFLAVVGLAAVARFRLLPRVRATPEGGAEGTAGGSVAVEARRGGLRRLLAVEASCGAVVVAVAALLANTVPADEVLAAARAANVHGGPQTQVLPAGPLRLHLDLEPGTVGRNLLQVQVTDPKGRPVDGLAGVYLAIADSTGRVAPATANATHVGPATYRAVTDAFSLPGTWRVGAELPGASPDLTVGFAIAASPATTGATPPDPADAVVLGGRAGSALAGLTAMTAGDQLVVRVRGGLGIPPAVPPHPLLLLDPSGRPVQAIVQPCGDGCAEAFTTAPTRGPLGVAAILPGGTARFTLPIPLPRGGSAAQRLRIADRTLAASKSFRIHEILDGGLGTVYRTDYVIAAPNRARWHLNGGGTTADTVWIGQERWGRDGNDPWKVDSTDNQIHYPLRNWSDLEANVSDLGPTTWHGTLVDVLAFIDTANGAYHRLWVDRANRILHERMNAPGHFMDRGYTNYNTPVTITPPD